ncbi:MAG: hypothetical protein KA132_02970 [Thauera sp.]|nr:hypothetical protein [Thauera sp.]
MKISGVMTGVLLLGGVGLAGQAAAVCSGTALDAAQLSAAFSGNTVCAQRAGDRWQEYHQVGGALIDWKMGPGHGVDPSKHVGTWSATNTGMAYDYGSGGRYTYQVFDNSNANYSFCKDGAEMAVTVRSGQGACP